MSCIDLVRCVLVLRCGLAVVVWYLYAGISLSHGYHPNPPTPKLQHTSKQGTRNQCGDTIENVACS